MIDITTVDGETFEVRVSGQKTTSHTVTLRKEYYEKLTAGSVDADTLIRKSFEFLLQREPNTSILPSFDLTVIGRYFPEYEATIKRAL